jgi:hypothetical protein
MQLAAWRFLPLAGQVIHIPSYQRLCDMMYVGDALNPTADWWYKTSDEAGTVRDVSGQYMRVLDHRGLFPRAAGQNSKYKMANDAPYDGKSIGEFGNDTLPNILGRFKLRMQGTVPLASGMEGCFASELTDTGYMGIADGSVVEKIQKITFDPSLRFDRIANEVASASISSYLCIKY